MSNITLYALIAVFVAGMYFLTIRPQRKQTVETERKRSELKTGDRIITYGGVYGVVHEIEEISIIIAVEPEGNLMRISPKAISVFPADFKKIEDAKKNAAG